MRAVVRDAEVAQVKALAVAMAAASLAPAVAYASTSTLGKPLMCRQ